MALAEKYQNHPAFLEVSATADQALREIAEAFGCAGVIDNYETAAGNIVDDMTRLVLIMMEAKNRKATHAE